MRGKPFKKGMTPWNKGVPNTWYNPKGLKIGWELAKAKKEPKIHKVCANLDCNNDFYVAPYLNRVIYCSRSCVHKGKPGPNKGKIFSKEHRKKLSLAHKGKGGPTHWNWRGGGSRLERGRFRDQMQKRVFERDNYTCQFCGQRGGKLQVDHIQSWAKYVELRFEMKNCRTLCMKCHYQLTFKKPMPSERINWGHNFKHVGVKEELFQTISP